LSLKSWNDPGRKEGEIERDIRTRKKIARNRLEKEKGLFAD
jgi:hypothetical protein